MSAASDRGGRGWGGGGGIEVNEVEWNVKSEIITIIFLSFTAGSRLGKSVGIFKKNQKIFRVNILCWLLFRYPFHSLLLQ